MNDFERRLLDTVQSSSWIAAIARQDKTITDVEYYTYSAVVGPVLPITAGVSGTGQSIIQIQSDSDFAICYFSGMAVNTANGAVNLYPNAQIQITDSGTGKTFFSAPTLFPLVMGNSGLPFYLPTPRVLSPNTNITCALTNNDNAVTYNYYISFLGARIYYA